MAKCFVLFTPIGVVYKDVFYGDELSTSKGGGGTFEGAVNVIVFVDWGKE